MAGAAPEIDPDSKMATHIRQPVGQPLRGLDKQKIVGFSGCDRPFATPPHKGAIENKHRVGRHHEGEVITGTPLSGYQL
jgi:hypothetical protein